MQSRREFLRNAAALAGAGSAFGGLIQAIQTAAAIEPEKGSGFLDAEHIVILMQENRSFDHAFGTLRGVRGFDDPRAIQLADGNPVWVQSNSAGQRYVPFRLDIKESKSTWMGCLPHGWSDQVDAANGGKHDRWLNVKRSSNKTYATMPLTLGYHTREDIPFYYALADAFTICDQNFCSTLTGTTPNRLHLMTGTIREKPSPDQPALVRNEDCDYGSWCHWTTFPERLQDAGVSWKIYQNELTVPTGLSDDEDAWLANFGCNPIEWFSQFNVRLVDRHRAFLARRVKEIPGEIAKLRAQLETKPADAASIQKRIETLTAQLSSTQKDLAEFTAEKFAQLSARDKSLHERAFVTNQSDPAFRELSEIHYTDGGKVHRVKVPKSDVFHQFRQDVMSGNLPTVSWLTPPERFSDHPCSAWYGQWYLSEVLNILTKNPEVWKKTIFILTYDENDGYFDHVPPFQAPHPTNRDSGLATTGIDTSLDHLELSVDRKHKPRGAVRGNSLGLGFRVPMIIASPWTRGGCVCSQVFDHTSVIRFLEKFASHKAHKKVEEPNITAWRRTVCGDLTSAFQSATDAQSGLRSFIKRDPLIESIHKAQFKNLPDGFRVLSDDDVKRVSARSPESPMARQEPGVRRSSPLPYDLDVNGQLSDTGDRFVIRFAAKNDRFGADSAGSPFIVYAMTTGGLKVRHYAVAAGQQLEDSWPLDDFANKKYQLRVHGPNGFFREFAGSRGDASVNCGLQYVVNKTAYPNGAVQLNVENRGNDSRTIFVRDLSYGHAPVTVTVPASRTATIVISTPESCGWYDLSVTLDGAFGYERHYAGRVETGQWSISDPLIGRVVS